MFNGSDGENDAGSEYFRRLQKPTTALVLGSELSF